MRGAPEPKRARLDKRSHRVAQRSGRAEKERQPEESEPIANVKVEPGATVDDQSQVSVPLAIE